MDEMVQHAIQDATQSGDPALRREARAWLQVCCPDIADQLPPVGAETRCTVLHVDAIRSSTIHISFTSGCDNRSISPHQQDQPTL